MSWVLMSWVLRDEYLSTRDPMTDSLPTYLTGKNELSAG